MGIGGHPRSVSLDRLGSPSRSDTAVVSTHPDGDFFADGDTLISKDPDLATVIDAAVTDIDEFGSLFLRLGGDKSISGPIDLTDKSKGLTIGGVGDNATSLKLDGSVNDDLLVWDGSTATADDFFLTIENLQLHGRKNSNTAGSGIAFENLGTNTVRDVKLEDMFVRDFVDSNIIIEDAWGLRVENVVSEFSDSHGFWVKTNGTNAKFYGCKFNSNAGRGILLYTDYTWMAASETSTNAWGVEFGGGATDSGVVGHNAVQNTNADIRFQNCTRCSAHGVFDHVQWESGVTDCNVTPVGGWPTVTDNGATRPRWNGVIGGGPLGGVDLSTTTGQFDGDRAVANGTATGATAFDLAVWDSSLNTGAGGWHVFNSDATV